jgi:hypothetical protein
MIRKTTLLFTIALGGCATLLGTSAFAADYQDCSRESWVPANSEYCWVQQEIRNSGFVDLHGEWVPGRSKSSVAAVHRRPKVAQPRGAQPTDHSKDVS